MIILVYSDMGEAGKDAIIINHSILTDGSVFGFFDNRLVNLFGWIHIDFKDRLIFYRIYSETMSTSILIEKDETPRRKSSFDVSSIYSLVDKAYYVDGLHYKVDQWTEPAEKDVVLC